MTHPKDGELLAETLEWAQDLPRLAGIQPRAFGGGTRMATSLDHMMGFHRPVESDDWLLYELTRQRVVSILSAMSAYRLATVCALCLPLGLNQSGNEETADMTK